MERSSDARDSHFFKLLFVNIKKLVIESIILEMGAIGRHIKPILLCVDRTRILIKSNGLRIAKNNDKRELYCITKES